MQEFAIKGLESKGSDAEFRKSSIRRIVVEGYDTSRRREDVDGALREHFASCGNIIHVYVPIDVKSDIICRYALIYVNEEDEEKALRLDGSVMGGRILKISPYPFCANHLNDVFDSMKEDLFYRTQRTMLVSGCDASLPIDVIERQIEKYFFASGSLVYRGVTASGAATTLAKVYVWGHDVVEKALERSGRSVDGLNFVVTRVVPFQKKIIPTGYIHPQNFIKDDEQTEDPNIYSLYHKTETTAGNQKEKSKTTERNQKKKKRKSKTREGNQKKKSETRDGYQKMKGVQISF